jgi:UPF0716 protein FxsA
MNPIFLSILLVPVVEIYLLIKIGSESKNKPPTYEMISGAAIAFAALLLIIPGFATDILGFLLIFPISRNFFFSILSKKFKHKETKENNFIDGDYEDIENDDDRKI